MTVLVRLTVMVRFSALSKSTLHVRLTVLIRSPALVRLTIMIWLTVCFCRSLFHMLLEFVFCLSLYFSVHSDNRILEMSLEVFFWCSVPPEISLCVFYVLVFSRYQYIWCRISDSSDVCEEKATCKKFDLKSTGVEKAHRREVFGFYLKVGGSLPNIMLKLQYLIAFTDIDILLNKLPDTLILRIHYPHGSCKFPCICAYHLRKFRNL